MYVGACGLITNVYVSLKQPLSVSWTLCLPNYIYIYGFLIKVAKVHSQSVQVIVPFT